MGESADVEEIEFFPFSGAGRKAKLSVLVHDTPMRFILQYVEFSSLIWSITPVVKTKLNQFSLYIVPSVNWCQGRMMAEVMLSLVLLSALWCSICHCTKIMISIVH